MDNNFLTNDSLMNTETAQQKFDIENFFNGSSNEEVTRISVILLKRVLSVFEKHEVKTLLKGLIKMSPHLLSEFKEMI